MQSRIAQELRLRFQPVATIFTEEKPEGALQFEPGVRGCVIKMLTAAAEGQAAVFDRDTTGAPAGRRAFASGTRDTGASRGVSSTSLLRQE